MEKMAILRAGKHVHFELVKFISLNLKAITQMALMI